MLLGARIKKIRLEKSLTQDDIATKLGMGRSNVGHIENGRTMPAADVLDKIADILDTTTDYLLGRTDDPGKSKPYYALTDRDERDIAKQLEKIMIDLESKEALHFYNEPMDDDTKRLMQISLENSLRFAKEMAKRKFTPKKYRH